MPFSSLKYCNLEKYNFSKTIFEKSAPRAGPQNFSYWLFAYTFSDSWGWPMRSKWRPRPRGSKTGWQTNWRSWKNRISTWKCKTLTAMSRWSCSGKGWRNCRSLYILLIHSANPKSGPVGVIVFAHVVRPYVRTHFLNLEKQNNRKQCSLLAWLWVWPSGSLMTPVLYILY